MVAWLQCLFRYWSVCLHQVWSEVAYYCEFCVNVHSKNLICFHWAGNMYIVWNIYKLMLTLNAITCVRYAITYTLIQYWWWYFLVSSNYEFIKYITWKILVLWIYVSIRCSNSPFNKSSTYSIFYGANTVVFYEHVKC